MACRGRGCPFPSRRRSASRTRSTRLGFHFFEGGFPSSNPKEIEFFDAIEGETFENIVVAAFGMTRRKGVTAEHDEALRVLVESFAPVSTIVGKTWSLHLEKVTKVSPRREPRDDRRLRQIPDRRRQARDLRRRTLL